jgi:hypothetical protein
LHPLTTFGGIAQRGVGGLLLGVPDVLGFAGCKKGYQGSVGDATKRLQKAYLDNRKLSSEAREKADAEAERQYRNDLSDAYEAFLRNKAVTDATTTDSEDNDTGYSGCESAYMAMFASATKWLTDQYRRAKAIAEEGSNSPAALRKAADVKHEANQEYQRRISAAAKALAQNTRAFGR